MAILRIRTFGDPVLRQRAREVDGVTDLHRRLIQDMFDTMREAPGVGLAATQVGVVERIFVYELEDVHGEVINPVISKPSGESETDDEGCLSLPGLVYPVERRLAVHLDGTDAEGDPVSVDATGLLARIFQHEVDHLNGVLFIDHLTDELRGEALGVLRAEALGLEPPGRTRDVPAEETL